MENFHLAYEYAKRLALGQHTVVWTCPSHGVQKCVTMCRVPSLFMQPPLLCLAGSVPLGESSGACGHGQELCQTASPLYTVCVPGPAPRGCYPVTGCSPTLVHLHIRYVYSCIMYLLLISNLYGSAM